MLIAATLVRMHANDINPLVKRQLRFSFEFSKRTQFALKLATVLFYFTLIPLDLILKYTYHFRRPLHRLVG